MSSPRDRRNRWASASRPKQLTLAAVVLALLFAAPIALHARLGVLDVSESDLPTGTLESASLIATRDGRHLLSANFDAGSVSRLSAETGERIAESVLGEDLRRLALSADQRVLAVSDYASGRVVLLDADSLAVRDRVSVGPRPFGIIHEPRRDLFWVSLFEAAELVAIDRLGRERARLPVGETPRGLALTRDGRLLVTHAMLGEVSVFDARAFPPRLLRRVELGMTSDPDPFVSQGRPRLLDDIAISPDQREAWLPHVLWSFDHPFQFRSTIFPAVSVLSLEVGEERERLDRRKELFRQIDLRDSASKTRIVSNPHDVAFSPAGDKAYVTFSGSEDLVVFDLARRAPDSAPRRTRRRGKQSQGGAQAIQVLRHLPGDLPKGIVVRGDELFVQHAASLDVARLSRGGEGPFARVKLLDEKFGALVASDPLPADVRRGQRIFFSANSDEFAETPLAGDFWMSCGSCHLDGFNFTNRFLMRDAQRAPKSDAGNATTGHRGLDGFVARDFVGDYVRMIQDTQGGMGADERMQLERVDPRRPSEAVQSMMRDLHAFVTTSDNLPHLSTWLRIDQPERHTDEAQWSSSEDCAGCHSEIHAQWQTSNHHRMGSSHPYYLVLEDLAAEEEGEAFRAWCMGCHNPRHLASGRASSHAPGVGASSPGGRATRGRVESTRAQSGADPLGEGTDCLFCHRVTRLEHAGGNASLTVNLRDRPTYPFEGSEFGALRWFSDRLIASRPEVHAESYLDEAYGDPRYCGSCHSEFTPGPGAVVSDTYAEWAASPYNRPDEPERHRTCADCHMHADVERIGEPIPGRATDGGRWKRNVRTHRFTGASVDLLDSRDPTAAAQSLALLRSAAELEVTLSSDTGPGEARRLRVRIRNVGAGHHLPTGVADLRQLWLYVRVADAGGRILIDAGELDSAGELPADARIFNKVLGDAQGEPVGLRFWNYETLLRDTRIPAGEHRDEDFALPEDAAFPLDVAVELRFRSFPRAFSLRVQRAFPELELPPVHRLLRVERRLQGS